MKSCDSYWINGNRFFFKKKRTVRIFFIFAVYSKKTILNFVDDYKELDY